MIVDVHTHLPKYKERAENKAENETREREFRVAVRKSRTLGTISEEGRTSWTDHFEAMKIVDKAIVFGIARYGKTQNVNDVIAEYVKKHPNKIIGFLSVDPNDPKCIEEMRRSVNELGLKGLKTGPLYQGYHPDSYKATLVFKEAERMGIPVMFHQATAPGYENLLEVAQPLLLEKVAHQFPDLKIIYAHMGHPWWREVLMVVRRNKNTFADISANFYHYWDFYNSLELAREWGQLDKLLFGSDYPVTTPKETMNGIRSINNMLEGTKLPRIPDEMIEEIINRDALDLLGIK
jgi:predicted TIM-barrel fold metal-dependent hydrolase